MSAASDAVEKVALAIAMFAFETAARELVPRLRARALARARELLDDKMIELRNDAQALLDERHRQTLAAEKELPTEPSSEPPDPEKVE